MALAAAPPRPTVRGSAAGEGLAPAERAARAGRECPAAVVARPRGYTSGGWLCHGGGSVGGLTAAADGAAPAPSALAGQRACRTRCGEGGVCTAHGQIVCWTARVVPVGSATGRSGQPPSGSSPAGAWDGGTRTGFGPAPRATPRSERPHVKGGRQVGRAHPSHPPKTHRHTAHGAAHLAS